MKKRSVNIAGHQTSISMEEEFWAALKSLAEQQHKSLNQLIGEIDKTRKGNLSSAVRVYVLRQFQDGL